jgi:pyroglutamyl-peptidase
MRKPRLLVTGFGPFPGMPRNPSGAVARLVAADRRWARNGVSAKALVLPTTYAAIERELAPALRKVDAVLMIGVAGRSRRLRVESRAVNRASPLLPDAGGSRPGDAALAGSAGRASDQGPIPAALAVLRSAGLPSRPSQDAGRYLCNAAYFRALAEPTPVLFIHIPKPPRRDRPRRSARLRPAPWPTQVAAALARLADELLRRTRRAGVEA